MAAKIDMVGRKYGWLTVIEEVDRDKWGKKNLRVRCECGTIKVLNYSNLQSGGTRSCGCKKIELLRIGSTKHGLRYHPLYECWRTQKRRCFDKKHHQYHNYGARGITMSDEFRDSFATWLDHIGEKPSPKHSADRIDNSRGYERGNLRWATPKEQLRNTRVNIIYQYLGVSHCLMEWAERKNMNYQTLYARISRGWSIEKTLSTPCGPFKVS